MVRQFDNGVNQISQVSGGKSNTVLAYLDTGEITADVHSVFEIKEYYIGTKVYIVQRPSEDSISPTKLLFAKATVEAEDDFTATSHTPAWIAFDSTSGTPALGDEVGTATDSYKLSLSQTGFICLAYDSTNELVYVKANTGGGGALITLAEITNASSGTSSAQHIRYIDGTPNYETYGSSISCKYPYSG